MNGTADQRAGAALIVARRRQPVHLNVLAALARDSDPWVRDVVANQLTDWIRDDVAADSASVLLRRILDSDGTLVARMVAVRLDGSSRTAATDRITVQLELEDPASAYVRTQVAAHRSLAAGGETSPSSSLLFDRAVTSPRYRRLTGATVSSATPTPLSRRVAARWSSRSVRTRVPNCGSRRSEGLFVGAHGRGGRLLRAS